MLNVDVSNNCHAIFDNTIIVTRERAVENPSAIEGLTADISNSRTELYHKRNAQRVCLKFPKSIWWVFWPRRKAMLYQPQSIFYFYWTIFLIFESFWVSLYYHFHICSFHKLFEQRRQNYFVQTCHKREGPLYQWETLFHHNRTWPVL